MHYNDSVFKAVQDSEWSTSQPHRCARRHLRLRSGKRSSNAPTGQPLAGRRTILVYGRTYAGRYLLVVAIDENGAAFIVTARDMTDAEKKTFRRKAR